MYADMYFTEEEIDLLVAGLKALQLVDRLMPDLNADRGEWQSKLITEMIERLEKNKR